jgi:tetratricopeptide (TPR) repeat protein
MVNRWATFKSVIETMALLAIATAIVYTSLLEGPRRAGSAAGIRPPRPALPLPTEPISLAGAQIAGSSAAKVPMRPAASEPSSEALRVESVLESYERGDYTIAARLIEGVEEPRALDLLDAALKERAKGWINGVDVSQRRRRAFVAGAVALEVIHALIERESWATGRRSNNRAVNPEGLPYITRIIASHSSRPDRLQHDWTMAQLATWQKWNARARLTNSDDRVTPEPVWAVLMGEPPLIQLSKTQNAFGDGGYLREALARFPRDPRLILARAEGRESIETRCSVLFCRDEMTPEVLDDLRRRANVTPPEGIGPDSVRARWIHETAVANLRAFDRLQPVAAEFAAAATAHPEIRAEASVHIGYLAIRAARPDAALAPLATAVGSADSYVRYLGEYFTGRALEAMGHRSEAIAAYRRALSVVPNSPSASTFLAAQLFVSDDGAEREEAFHVLHAANTSWPRPVDPWDLYWYGDARLWPVYMDRLRQALRQ